MQKGHRIVIARRTFVRDISEKVPIPPPHSGYYRRKIGDEQVTVELSIDAIKLIERMSHRIRIGGQDKTTASNGAIVLQVVKPRKEKSKK